MVVNVKIKEDRVEEFLDVIEKDAVGSRGEAGCLRFDVLRSQDDPLAFTFYEMYENQDAVTVHKEQPHYKLWADFKASGGIEPDSQTVSKSFAIFTDVDRMRGPDGCVVLRSDGPDGAGPVMYLHVESEEVMEDRVPDFVLEKLLPLERVLDLDLSDPDKKLAQGTCRDIRWRLADRGFYVQRGDERL